MTAGNISIDLNADLGEECGDDIAMLDIVTSANLAAGAHAGGGGVLYGVAVEAVKRGIQIGAHISYGDRENFGRISRLHAATPAMVDSFVDQIQTVAQAAEEAGGTISYVKAHGALYNDAAAHYSAAAMLVAAHRRAAQELGYLLPAMGLPNSQLHLLMDREHLPFVAEGFADRAYTSEGTLMPRSEPNSVYEDTKRVVEQARLMSMGQRVVVSDGSSIPMPVETICLHGDTPNTLAHATAVRAALETHGVVIEPFRRARITFAR